MKGRLLFYADNTQEKSFTSFLLRHCIKKVRIDGCWQCPELSLNQNRQLTPPLLEVYIFDKYRKLSAHHRVHAARSAQFFSIPETQILSTPEFFLFFPFSRLLPLLRANTEKGRKLGYIVSCSCHASRCWHYNKHYLHCTRRPLSSVLTFSAKAIFSCGQK